MAGVSAIVGLETAQHAIELIVEQGEGARGGGPHRWAAWIRFRERLDEAAAFADDTDGEPEARVVLDGVAATLRSIGGALRRHSVDAP